MNREYKKVRKMYLICESCEESNETVKVYNSYNKILCRKCFNKIKKQKIEASEDNLYFEPSYDYPKYDEEGNVMCNECGKFFSGLGNHLRIAHNMTTPQYRKKYNYHRKTVLISKKYYEICIHRMDKINIEKSIKKEKEKKNNEQLELEINYK